MIVTKRSNGTVVTKRFGMGERLGIFESNKVYNFNALDGLRLLPDNSIQMVMTSPPYWGLRDYQTPGIVWGGKSDCDHEWDSYQSTLLHENRNGIGESSSFAGKKQKSNNGYVTETAGFCIHCGAWLGSLGLEPTHTMFIDHLVEIFSEVKRVLRPDGICFVNLGDSYAGGQSRGASELSRKQSTNKGTYFMNGKSAIIPIGLKPKDLCLIPQRFVIAMQDAGWWVRRDIIWCKGLSLCPTYSGSSMPESATDRPSSSHEYVYMFTKSQKYYYDHVAVREVAAYDGRKDTRMKGSVKYGNGFTPVGAHQSVALRGHERWPNTMDDGERARNLRSVWAINPAPYSEAHFACFPPKLVETCVKMGTPEWGCCPDCYTPWERVYGKKVSFEGGSGKAGRTAEEVNSNGKWAGVQHGTNIKLGPVITTTTLGWRPTCKCYDDRYRSEMPRVRSTRKRYQQDVANRWFSRVRKRPAPFSWARDKCIVLDPFMGSGTTAMIAKELKQYYLGFDLNPEYLKLVDGRVGPDSFEDML